MPLTDAYKKKILGKLQQMIDAYPKAYQHLIKALDDLDFIGISEIKELTDEQVMNLVEYYEDSAYLSSKSVESNYNNAEENAEVFEKAIDVVDQELIGYEFIEVEYCGNYYRAIWHKIS